MEPITLNYGKIRVTFDLGRGNYNILQPDKVIPVSNPEQYLANVIDNPSGCPPIEQIFSSNDNILIVVSDITRRTGAEIFMPILLERLNKIGVPDEQISVLFALGIHRKLSKEERSFILGEEVYERVKSSDHDSNDRDQMEYVGETLRGTPILINRKILSADGLILTGGIAFHYLAGFGGGGKALLPGVSSRESCMAFHRIILKSSGYGVRPKSYAGLLDHNPMQEDILETANKIAPDFLINTITNSSGRIIHAVAGNLSESHKKGCEEFLKLNSAPIKEKADLVIVSCGGYPKDINFIQAHKSIEHAFQAVKEGGAMIALAECSDGFGNPAFLDWFNYEEKEIFLDNLHNRFEINGQTAFSTYMKASLVKIILISNLKEEDVVKMNMIPAADIQEALSISKDYLNEKNSIFVMPEGANTLPICKKD